jgi:hypothetical protein
MGGRDRGRMGGGDYIVQVSAIKLCMVMDLYDFGTFFFCSEEGGKRLL